jgi:uncharacterized membrane protein YgaE (UPF0421/DUF939 family)
VNQGNLLRDNKCIGNITLVDTLIMDKQQFRSIAIYIVECLIGFSAGFALYKYFPQHQFFWSMISVLLVLAPGNLNSRKLAFDRMKANTLGSLTGLLVFLLPLPEFISIGLGIVIVISAGYLFKLDTAVRSALAALIIVTVHGIGGATWNVAVERMICVITGCIIGLVITIMFDFFLRPQTTDVPNRD